MVCVGVSFSHVFTHCPSGLRTCDPSGRGARVARHGSSVRREWVRSGVFFAGAGPGFRGGMDRARYRGLSQPGLPQPRLRAGHRYSGGGGVPGGGPAGTDACLRFLCLCMRRGSSRRGRFHPRPGAHAVLAVQHSTLHQPVAPVPRGPLGRRLALRFPFRYPGAGRRLCRDSAGADGMDIPVPVSGPPSPT